MVLAMQAIVHGKWAILGDGTGSFSAIRASIIRHATTEVYHSSGSWAPIGIAAGCAQLLKLNRAALLEAMGTAEYHAPISPMMKNVPRPSNGKDSLGWGAMVGLSSVLMARSGFTGVRPLFADAPNPAMVEDIGTNFRLMASHCKVNASTRVMRECPWYHPQPLQSPGYAENN